MTYISIGNNRDKNRMPDVEIDKPTWNHVNIELKDIDKFILKLQNVAEIAKELKLNNLLRNKINAKIEIRES